MQEIGDVAEEGFNLQDLINAKNKYEALGCECKIVHLNKYLPEGYEAMDAYLLVVRNGINAMLQQENKSATDLEAEQTKLTPDKKYFDARQGRVLDKTTRWNLCFSEQGQKADMNAGEGTIVSYKDVPLL